VSSSAPESPLTQLEMLLKKSLTPLSPAERMLSGIEVKRLRKEVKASDWSEVRGREGSLALVELENGDFMVADRRGPIWEAESVCWLEPRNGAGKLDCDDGAS